MHFYQKERLSLPLVLDAAAAAALLAVLAHMLFYSVSSGSSLSPVVGLLTFISSAIGFGYAAKRLSARRKRKLYPTALALYLSDTAIGESASAFIRLCAQLICTDGFIPMAAGSLQPTFVLENKKYMLFALRRHASCPVTAQHVLEACDKAALAGCSSIICSSAPFSPEAVVLARQKAARLYDPMQLSVLMQRSGQSIPQHSLKEYLSHAAAQKRARLSLGRRLSSCGRFTVTGLMLFALSFTSPRRLWYLSLSFVCIAVALAKLFRPAKTPSH